MDFNGLQKLTLLDYPGKVACTFFTGGCNFRCPFCQNSELVLGHPFETIPDSEILSFLAKRQGVLDGVCVTGGEPLLHDLAPFLAKVKDAGYLVKLDTNGAFPVRLKNLVKQNLVDYVAMDLKSSQETYARAAGVQIDLDGIRASVDFLLSDVVDYEFRTTVVRELHTEQDFVSIGKWIVGAKRYYLQGFVDSEYVLEKGLTAYTRRELDAFCEILRRTVPNTFIRGVE